MNKNMIWLLFAILCIYFLLISCEEFKTVQELKNSKDFNNLLISDATALQEGARTKKHRHHLYSFWGFYGLAIAYLIKIKVVVVAFFVGSAVYLGLRYLWPHKCADNEIYKEGSIVLDHPPTFAHHDHIPYSLDHEHENYDGDTFGSNGPMAYEPYSAYSSYSLSESDGSFPSDLYTESSGPSYGGLSSDAPASRRKRSDQIDTQANKKITGTLENLARQMILSEENIAEFMFNFLGLDTNACRKRFICEMEFKAKTHPLTSMAFRILGHSLFAKYINSQNLLRKANSFQECAAVNEECVFIENSVATEEETTLATDQEYYNTVSEAQKETNKIRNETAKKESSFESNDLTEEENESNLKKELIRNFNRKHLRGDRHLKFF